MPYAVAATAWDADPAPGRHGRAAALQRGQRQDVRRAAGVPRRAPLAGPRADSVIRAIFPAKLRFAAFLAGAQQADCNRVGVVVKLLASAAVLLCALALVSPALAAKPADFERAAPHAAQREGDRTARVQPGGPALARQGDARRGAASAPRRRLGTLAASRRARAGRLGSRLGRAGAHGPVPARQAGAGTSAPLRGGRASAARRFAPPRPQPRPSPTSRVRTGAPRAACRAGRRATGASGRCRCITPSPSTTTRRKRHRRSCSPSAATTATRTAGTTSATTRSSTSTGRSTRAAPAASTRP